MQGYTHVMVALVEGPVVAYPLVTLLLLAVPVAHDLAKQPEPLAALAACPALLALPVLLLLLEACSAKAAVAAVVVLLALAVRAALEVAALAAVVVVLRAVHTPPVLVVSVVMAGHWYWSFDYAAICRC